MFHWKTTPTYYLLVTLDEILQQIKSEPKLKTRIETLRKHLAEGNKTAYDLHFANDCIS